jgi:hypothetical protein
VPSSFVVLDALPLTSNGKVDRRALEGLGERGADTGEAFLPPRTPMEVLVARVFQEALSQSRVGAHDNFFDLGGHSLLSLRVIARIEKLTGSRLGPRDLIFQTVEQLAATCVERGGQVAAAADSPDGAPDGTEGATEGQGHAPDGLGQEAGL